MAAKKHTYIITINQFSYAEEDLCRYRYGQTHCELATSDGRACVKYQMGVLKTAEEVIHSPLASDALRKMHLYHVMRCGKALRVGKIVVSIDGHATTFTKDAPGFPFVITMLGSRDLALPEGWKDPGFHESVLGATKTAAADDLRFVCLYSFLAGTGKRFQIDRFTCYWTAMNAHYNYLVARYKETVDQTTLSASAKKLLKKVSERGAISALLRVVCGSGVRSAKNFNENYRDLTYSFRRIHRDTLDDLYDDLYAHRADPSHIPAGYDEDSRCLGAQLQTLLPLLKMSAYGCILLDYAYYMRCEYLHGSHTPPLFVNSNDPEIAAFRVLNLFLERYLKDHIPAMFAPGWMDAEKQNAITALFTSNDLNG